MTGGASGRLGLAVALQGWTNTTQINLHSTFFSWHRAVFSGNEGGGLGGGELGDERWEGI